MEICRVEDRADAVDISTRRRISISYSVPSVCHKRRQYLLGDEAPTLGADGMRQHGRRCHSPRPFCFGRDVGVDGPRIAHVVDAATEESLHRCAEIEGDHAGCYRSHSRCLHAGRWSLVGLLRALRGAIAMGIAAGNDSRAGTGAGRHCISWEGRTGGSCICE